MKITTIALIVSVLTAAYFLTNKSTPTVELTDDFVGNEFLQFVTKFGASYMTKEEYAFRQGVFRQNLERIAEHNAKGLRWTQGVNKFADWTQEEFASINGFIHDEEAEGETVSFTANADSVDWRNTIATTNVKDQGRCGSCWSFSADGTVDGWYSIRAGEAFDFSQQQLCDCDRNKVISILGNMGCSGGRMFMAVDYYKKHLAALQADYPYVSGDGSDKLPCHEELGTVDTGIKGHNFV